MSRSLRLTACAIVAACAGGACVLGDLFESAGPGDVVFRWTGDSVITRDVPTPFRVDLLVDGVVIDQPSVRLSIPDTTNFHFASTQDSLIGIRNGTGDIVAYIESSLGGRLDTTFQVRVRP